MTTAHRPTWKAAVGQANEGGWTAGGAVTHQRSALDAPAHTKLKPRHAWMDSNQEHRRRRHNILQQQSLLALAEAEANHVRHTIGKRAVDPETEARGKLLLLKHTAEVDVERIRKTYDDADVVDDDDGGGGGEDDNDIEKDSDLDEKDSDLDDDDDESDDDSDDEAALQAELAKIRAERQAVQMQQEHKLAASEQRAAAEAAIHGNPLLNNDSSDCTKTRGGQLKRRWNDDVVFRNQAKGEPVPQKRFINDTVRNDFHKRFLNKFMR